MSTIKNEKIDELFNRQLDIAYEDVKAFVRQYLASRTGASHYARYGCIFSPKELKLIKDFAEMLVDIVND